MVLCYYLFSVNDYDFFSVGIFLCLWFGLVLYLINKYILDLLFSMYSSNKIDSIF